MSPDNPSAAPSVRRRHSKPSASSPDGNDGLHRRLRTITVLPASAVMLDGAVGCLMYAEPLSPAVKVLAVATAAAGSAAAVVVSWRLAARTARALADKERAHAEAWERDVAHFRSTLAWSISHLSQTAEQVRRGDQPLVLDMPAPPADANPLTALDYSLRAFTRDVQQALISVADATEKTALLTLSHRIRSVIEQIFAALDRMENDTEDPDILRPIFQLDHLAVRLRRLTDSIALVGGYRKRWSQAMSLHEVVTRAMSEISQYPRVRDFPPIEGTVVGHAAPGLTHALAELMDNAANFSAPTTTVDVRVKRVAAGVVIEIDDSGEILTDDERDRLNTVLSGTGKRSGADFAREGRLGMWVVSEYARQLNLTVLLQANFYGGNQATVFVPSDLFEPGHEARQDPWQTTQSPASTGTTSAVPASGLAAAVHMAPDQVRGHVPQAGPHRPATGPSGSDPGQRDAPPGREHPLGAPAARSRPQELAPPNAGGPARTGTPPTLPVRDPARSYLAAPLRNRPADGAAPPADASASRGGAQAMSQFVDGRRRADAETRPVDDTRSNT